MSVDELAKMHREATQMLEKISSLHKYLSGTFQAKSQRHSAVIAAAMAELGLRQFLLQVEELQSYVSPSVDLSDMPIEFPE
jgi:hypothetical protein